MGFVGPAEDGEAAAFGPSVSLSRAWLPSHQGGVVVRLHRHNQASPLSLAVNSSGSMPVPLWEPSQKGCSRLRPQAHHQ